MMILLKKHWLPIEEEKMGTLKNKKQSEMKGIEDLKNHLGK
jgi:hypothetical protein